MEGQGGHEENTGQNIPEKSPKKTRAEEFVRLQSEKSRLSALIAEQERDGIVPELDENGESVTAIRIAAIKTEIATMGSTQNREAYQNSQREYTQQPEIRRITKIEAKEAERKTSLAQKEALKAKKEREEVASQRRPISDRRRLSLPHLRPSPAPIPQPI